MAITVELMGGLGNQLFQYAFARSLAVARDTTLRLDVTWYGYSDDRVFMLDRYSLIERPGVEVVCVEILPAMRRKVSHLAARLSNGLIPGLPLTITESAPGFDVRFLSLPSNCRLVGYWQSEKYFQSIAEQIKEDFVPRGSLTRERSELAGRLAEDGTVAIHVRLGDYRANAAVARFHGSCSPDYYRSAMRRFDDLFRTPTYYLFSDEPRLAQEMLAGPNVHVVDTYSDGHDEQDLYLMSLANGHIIANSSFSWWGAWLSQRAGKVIAPHPWIQDVEWSGFSPVPDAWTII